jgi:cold shock CspA family protein/ribosome-associated translation inhibitor RaiA
MLVEFSIHPMEHLHMSESVARVVEIPEVRQEAIMQVPLEITFRQMEHSDAIENDVLLHAEKLEEFSDRITSCRVVVEAPHHHHRKGNLYHVRVLVSVPRRELIVDREPDLHHAHEDAHVTIRDAFDAMRRQLEDYVREIRGQVKAHTVQPEGKVARLFPDEGFGFIQAADGREIYFHRNSVLEDRFTKLQVGDSVRFAEEEGEKGPQASTVHLVGQ